MTPRVSLGESQTEFIRRIQEILIGSEIQHARIIGEPGIGKTRLALEAIKQLPMLAAKAIYIPQAEYFQNSRLFFELLKDDREYSAVLVIDECDDDDRASIFNALRGRPRLKLVTIDHGPELTSDALMEVVKFPGLKDAQIEEILREYIGKSVHTHNWVSWCEGSARVAHAVGYNLKRNPQDILKSPATVPIWDRFVLGYKKIKGEPAERLMFALRGGPTQASAMDRVDFAAVLQGRRLMGHFDTGVRRGPDSSYYSQRRDAARTWLSATMSPQVREWLGEFIPMLSRYIDEARISEERDF